MPPLTPAVAVSSIFNLTGLFQSLPSLSRTHAFTKCSACLFSTTASQQFHRKKKVKKRIDPYRAAQARQRKAANLARQKVLQRERQQALGDPVLSQPTDFVNSLRSNATTQAIQAAYMNYFVKPEDMQKSMEYSKWLTEPIGGEGDPQRREEEIRRHQASHANASRALALIASLDNGNSKDRTRVNIQRCIEEFGRHNTDSDLPPKPASTHAAEAAALEDGGAGTVVEEIPKRVGPDTGSSEVQVAILTAKINVLAENLGKKDKHNKRSLRLLVHKRQKLLSYLRRKERGGPRWQHLVEKLGINDAMWKGEISL